MVAADRSVAARGSARVRAGNGHDQAATALPGAGPRDAGQGHHRHRRRPASDVAGAPDFVKLAEAYGARGLRATRPEELSAVLDAGLNAPGVAVLDIHVTPEENVYPMVPPGAGLKEMVLR